MKVTFDRENLPHKWNYCPSKHETKGVYEMKAKRCSQLVCMGFWKPCVRIYDHYKFQKFVTNCKFSPAKQQQHLSHDIHILRIHTIKYKISCKVPGRHCVKSIARKLRSKNSILLSEVLVDFVVGKKKKKTTYACESL